MSQEAIPPNLVTRNILKAYLADNKAFGTQLNCKLDIFDDKRRCPARFLAEAKKYGLPALERGINDLVPVVCHGTSAPACNEAGGCPVKEYTTRHR